MVELYVLVIFMIVGSLIALEARDLLSSVVAVGAVGLALAIAFLLLRAPDVALTQLVVEIFTVVILSRATLARGGGGGAAGVWGSAPESVRTVSRCRRGADGRGQLGGLGHPRLPGL